jgi:hypothetical protein
MLSISQTDKIKELDKCTLKLLLHLKIQQVGISLQNTLTCLIMELINSNLNLRLYLQLINKKVLRGSSKIKSHFLISKLIFLGLSSHVEIANKTYYIDFHQVTKADALVKCNGLKMDLVAFEDVQEYKDVTAWLLDQG